MEPISEDPILAASPQPNSARQEAAKCWIKRLSLHQFRNYAALTLECDARPVVLTGANGAGKTNLLEAISLFAPGRGMRRMAYRELSRVEGGQAWAINAEVATPLGSLRLGTGLDPKASISNPAAQRGERAERAGRIVRIDGETMKSANVLSEYLHLSWLTPAMDGLFTGPAADRRSFIDRLIASFDASYRKRLSQFERAMRQRNRLLEMGERQALHFEGLELQMAEIGVALAAGRVEIVQRLRSVIEARRTRAPDDPFPWSVLLLEGILEQKLELGEAAVDVEDHYIQLLSANRERDRAARRTLDGPHRSDFLVRHGPKNMPAHNCSTGEQKALLTGLMLAHLELVAQLHGGAAPIILLDEIAAHLDEVRRAALFEEILRLGTQAWMTGTDSSMFAHFGNRAQMLNVDQGAVS